MSKKYNHSQIEDKWQKKWQASNTYEPSLDSAQKPFYNLMMFPYPSAEGLHVGNMYAFTGADIYGRFQRMQGYDVFEPIGLDGFGIHSENYAIKIGKHPKDHAKTSQKNFYKQLSSIGNGFAWNHRLETYDPDYYRWTQWLFIQMFNRGLAYKKAAMVNWCPSCKTVLADEQVEAGRCERCKSEVERREMSSWFFKITDYADRLLENIETIDWPEKIKTAQRQWIGKNKGLTIRFNIAGVDKPLEVWTKYWETIFGVTFIVVAPEHEVLSALPIPEEFQEKVAEYIKDSLNKTEQDRKTYSGKSGVFTGVYAVNPVNGQKVPVWVADYVLAGVGTAAVMGVPAHDQRDFEFASKYDLDIVQVVQYSDIEIDNKVSKKESSHEGEGKLINSGNFNGLEAWGEGKQKIANWIIEKGYGDWHTDYHLRDWLISRQRYWGPPIPMLYCEACAQNNKGAREDLPGWYPVDEHELPVTLPDIDDFKPKGDGTSPLANAPKEWQNVKCPSCGGQARRELDVSDTFLDSSWYFLRYPSLHSSPLTDHRSLPWNPKITKKWLPVNAYIGGAEHAVLHLLYARFVTMVLKDAGLVDFEEPFPFLFGHGLIIKDGAKMSKSKGNVVIPDEYIAKFGADTLRAYLMFLGPYDQGGDFRDTGIEGMHRFLMRVWSIFTSDQKLTDKAKVDIKLHQTIKKATSDISAFRYNTAISAVMELVNTIRQYGASKEHLVALSQLLAPFAPHMMEEVWVNVLGQEFSIHTSQWPEYDETMMRGQKVAVAVQINGKFRATLVDLEQSEAADEQYVAKEAKKLESVSKWLKDKDIKETIFVKGKVINFIITDN